MTQQINNTGIEQTFRGLINMYGEVPTYIIIPKIQRDYAQGREGKENLRKKFLSDLFEVFDTDRSTPRLYDYIYGKLEKPNQDHPDCYHFYPVDGQQRLTTMYLLHLYIGKRAKKNTDFLKYFSYQTRNSSKLFCEMLCNIAAEEYADIIEYIKDNDRYTSHWKNDPTISSMMRMLQDIDARFKSKQPFYTQQDYERCWDNLVNNVKFWMLDLSDLETTDDIYIKMNSRGKGLTKFENFKAELDNLVLQTSEGLDKGEFSMKIDTSWTNLFWNYRDNDNDWTETDFDQPEKPDYTDNGLDEKMLNFFRNYLTIEGLKNGSVSSSRMAERLGDIELASLVAKESPMIFINIRDILDFFCNLQKNGINISEWFERFLTKIPEEKRFEDNPEDATVRINPNPLTRDTPTDYLALLMEPQMTRTEKIFAYGIIYLILNRPGTFESIEHTSTDFEKLRILRNLIVNSEIHDDESDYHKGAMKQNLESVEILMNYGLLSLKSKQSEFSGVQIDQEIEKNNWLNSSGKANQVAMKQLENHSVLRGNLKMLYGISPLSLDKINNFRRLFINKACYDEIEQIALSFGDYSIKNGNTRNYAEKTINGWKDRIFINSNNDSLLMFEAMLNSGPMSYQDYVDHRDSFIADAQNKSIFDWRYYLTNYKSMRWAPKGCYLLEGEHYLYYMFNASTSIHSETYIHYNVYNDALYCLLGSDLLIEDDRGGALSIKNTGIKIDIQEREIYVMLSDGSCYHINIPNINDVDTVDRVQFSKDVVKKLILIANNGSPFDLDNFTSEDVSLLKNLEESDLDKEELIDLVKDKPKDIDEINSLIEYNDSQSE